MRGGVFYISRKYSKANNNYLKSYNPKQELKHIIYLDANSSYGYVMPRFLLIHGLKWIVPKELDSNKYSNNSSKVCVQEADLEYSKELCELDNDYHLAPDKIEIKEKKCCPNIN